MSNMACVSSDIIYYTCECSYRKQHAVVRRVDGSLMTWLSHGVLGNSQADQMLGLVFAATPCCGQYL